MDISKESLRLKYITIQGWMVTDLGLSGNDLVIYALIYGFSQDGKSVFSGSLKYISAFTGISKQSVVKVLARLIGGGLIEKKDRGSEEQNTYRAIKTSQESLPGQESLPSKESLQGVVTKVDTPYNITSINNVGSSITNTNNNKKILSNDNREKVDVSASDVKDLWNSIVTNCSKVTVLSEPRRKKVLSRIKEMGELGDVNEILTICLEKINNSSFCTGHNDRGWKASFDWFIDNGNNWVKVYEGKYDNKDGMTINSVRNSIVDYPDGTYSLKDFNNECLSQITQYGIEFRRALQRGSSIKKVNGRWTI